MQVRKRTHFALLLGVALVGCFLMFWSRKEKLSWWRIKLNGESYSILAHDKKNLFVGDNSGLIQAVDMESGQDNWRAEFNDGVFKSSVHGNRLIVMAGDTIAGFEKNTGRELWRYSTDAFVNVSDYLIVDSKILVFDRLGAVYALSLQTGSLLWKQTPTSLPTKISSIYTTSTGPRWSSLYMVRDGSLIFSPMNGDLVRYVIESGEVAWNQQSQDFITSMAFSQNGETILVGRKSGFFDTYNAYNGLLIHTTKYDKPVECVSVSSQIDWQVSEVVSLLGKFFDGFNILSFQLRALSENFQTLFPELGRSVEILLLEGGHLVGTLDKSQWQADLPGAIGCPQVWRDVAVFKTVDGKLVALDILSGKTMWEKQFSDKQIDFLSYHTVGAPNRLLSWLTADSRLTSPWLIASNMRGTGVFDLMSGDLKWQKEGIRSVFSSILSREEQVFYLSSINGYLDRVNSFSGEYIYDEQKQFTVSGNYQKLGDLPFYELTVVHDDTSYENPLLDVRLVGHFMHGDTQHRVNGFYYGKNMWKMRFVPSMPGEWEYALDWQSPFGKKENIFTGTFLSEEESSTTSAYVQVSSKNPIWLTKDDSTVWNGVGIQEFHFDRNLNGSFFDDYSMGIVGKEQFEATSSSGVYYNFGIDDYVGIDEYFDANVASGITMYRWNFDYLGYPLLLPQIDKLDINLENARGMDHLLSRLKTKNMTIWGVLFNFWFPFSHDIDIDRSERYIKPYIEYMIARYGPFIDIWELTNEAYIDKRLLLRVTDLFRNLDYQKKLLTTNWEMPAVEQLDIIAPHWYESEPLSESDVVTVKQASKFLSYPKPILFGEQGNVIANYDALSGQRMRIRLWTAFFNRSLLFFWNTSDRYFKAPSNLYGNIHIGDEERGYISAFRRLTSGLSIEAKMSKPGFTHCQTARLYGLSSNDLDMVYIINPSGRSEVSTCKLYLPENAREVVVYDPADGSELVKMDALGSSITLPAFGRDRFVKIYKNN